MNPIRELDEADIPQVVAVIRAAFAEYEGQLKPPSSTHHKTPEIVQRELEDGGGFVVSNEALIIGCVFYHNNADYIYLDRLAVLPDYRRCGIARSLIQSVEQHALRQGIAEVRLSVRLVLERQRALYEQLGYAFVSYGTHAGFAQPTFVTLGKRLKTHYAIL